MPDPGRLADLSGQPGPLPAHAGDLLEVLAEALRLFSRGAADRRLPFRTPTVVTVGLGSVPSAQTMVLRGFDPAAWHLVLHTDQRTGKLTDIAGPPRVAAHVYDARAGLQVRIFALAQVNVGDAV